MRIGYAVIAAFALFFSATEAAAQGRWLRAESAHFIVYGTGSENNLRRDVEELERFDATLRQLTQNRVAAAENKLEVYILRDRSQLTRVWPSAGRDVAGFYRAGAEYIAAFSIDRDQGLNSRAVLFHEYAHHFMFQYFADAYPAWFVEGFAEYVMTAELDNRRSRLGGYEEGRTYPLQNMTWANMEDLLAPNREGARRIQNYMFYAQSWINVHYILSSPERRRSFSTYLTAVQNGGDPITSFEQAFGMSLGDWQRQVRAYLSRGIALLDLPTTQTDIAMQITRLPPSADDLLLLMARARGRMSDEASAELAGDMISIASRYPGDAYAQLASARAELARNQYAAARPILEAMTEANPNDAEAYYMLGVSYFDEAQDTDTSDDVRGDLFLEARAHFARAFQLRPNHAPTLYYYAMTFPRPLDDNTITVLLRAGDLAPQVDDIGFNAAVALMERGEHAQAVPLLRPIAYAPHGGSLTRHARVTLDAALAGEDPPPPPSEEEPDEAEEN